MEARTNLFLASLSAILLISFDGCSKVQPTQPSTDTFTVPPPPLNGYQLKIGPFTISPKSEREVFLYRQLDNDSAAYVDSVDIVMRGHSHHFILYQYGGGDLTPGQLRDFNGTQDLSEMQRFPYRLLVIGSQTPAIHYRFPKDVVLSLPLKAGFDLNSYYVNSTDATITGEVYANLHTTPYREGLKIAKPIFDNNVFFSLPAGKITTLARTTLFQSPRTLIMLSSHAHKRNNAFKIYLVGGTRDGELVYENHEWDNPPIKIFDPPIVLQAGEGYRYEATYDNEASVDKGFGFTSEDEMCIVLGYYYN